MQNQSNTIAIVSYITFIGWIIAFIMRQNEKPQRELTRFHLKQSFGILALCFVYALTSWIFHLLFLGFIARLFGVVLFFLWLMGLISAMQGQFRPIPFIGKWFDETFTFIR